MLASIRYPTTPTTPKRNICFDCIFLTFRYLLQNFSVDKYCKRFCSHCRTEILSRIRPVAKLTTAITIRLAAAIAVGNLGTKPVSMNVHITGKPSKIETNANTIAIVKKRENGLSCFKK